ncbi:MAG TPA: beta-N-acetylhexosaminidase [Candidatus Glassbacteria bacterium]|nr:beta-N-acetylhexosaminidase [Candidatus Glassbacteria bacterium]
MRKTCLISVFSVVLSQALFPFPAAAEQATAPAVIPRPAQIEPGDGSFRLDEKTVLVYDRRFAGEADLLAERIRRSTGYPLPAVEAGRLEENDGSRNVICLLFDVAHGLGDEGYRLELSPERVVVKAAAAAGAFYGTQTLLQLFPPEILGPASLAGVEWTTPAVKVTDQPRFGWRAYLLDEARHFQGMETVKRLLDQCALHKLNVFQWHLVDDQGWRIEIRRYPNLTRIGSVRRDTQAGSWNSDQRAGIHHSGFYTQKQITEIVRYAAARHITIVPEIEMPGHASAAIASYPELGTAGRKIEVPVVFGKMYDTYNVADPQVYEMLENILSEVMALFPSDVIHIGGDEVRFDHWLASPQVQELMKREGLSGPAQVQLYFTNRISAFLESRGRRMMGWNEILGDDLHGFIKDSGGKEVASEGGGRKLAPNTIIHFWKGSLKLAERAVRQGHDIVNSLHSETYLDYDYQSIPLEKAYAFDPIPPGLEEKYQRQVIGMGCQMWGEWIPSRERLEYQTFPRLAAYAEVAWSPKETRNFEDFKLRLDRQKKRWDVAGIGYYDGK